MKTIDQNQTATFFKYMNNRYLIIVTFFFVCSMSSYTQIQSGQILQTVIEDEQVNTNENSSNQSTSAQVIDDQNAKETGTNRDDNKAKQQMSIIYDALQTALESKSKKIEEQEEQIRQLRSDTASYLQQILKQRDTIDALNKDKINLETEKNSYKNKYDSLLTELSQLDEVIYKQCLLYPLEAKYDKTSIEEAIRSINAIERLLETPSQKFKQCKDTYYPLLNKYNQYNEELIAGIKKHQEYIEATGWSIGDARRDRFKNEIKELPYYKECYINRNKPPYKSILYLDEVIDKYLKILDKTSNVQNDFREIISSLSSTR